MLIHIDLNSRSNCLETSGGSRANSNSCSRLKVQRFKWFMSWIRRAPSGRFVVQPPQGTLQPSSQLRPKNKSRTMDSACSSQSKNSSLSADGRDINERFDFSSWSWITEIPDTIADDPGEGGQDPALIALIEAKHEEAAWGVANLIAEGGLGDDDLPGVGEALKMKFRKMIESYPKGISIHKFASEFNKLYNYYPNYINFECASMEEFFGLLPSVFTVVHSPLKESLVFPPYVANKDYSPVKLFEQAWIQIQALLPLNGYLIKVLEIPELLLQHLQIELNPLDWHYGDDTAFFVYCFKEWQTPEIIFLEHDFDNSGQLVLVQLHSDYPETFKFQQRRAALKAEEEGKRVAMSKHLYDNNMTFMEYARLGAIMEYLMDDIKEGSYIKCVAGAIVDPGNFYVNNLTSWNDLERLMERMQYVYEKGSMCEYKKHRPFPETLVAGLYVAAKRRADSQWHRAIITDKLENGEFEILNVDYGDRAVVDIDSIRYLTIELLERLKAQAIACNSMLGQYYKSMDQSDVERFCVEEKWTAHEGDILRGMVMDEDLVIKFISKVPNNHVLYKGFPESAWKVYIHILDREVRHNAIHPDGLHLEREVINVSRGLYMTADGEETDEPGFVVLVSGRHFPGTQ